MRIRKIELLGFKSFKDRTVIHFDSGITGIVGPNGCGKSNIVDALVWVMGEMSAKDLRGSAMTDVIFAGAEGYAPMGMAEVSLVLENDGGPFPIQYLKHSEIMVTRRLHRDGESEYLINKEPARLKDVQEIFMDTGAGSKGFSIIQQGMIGRIITAKPEDRRMLIEEAAGITKFKARKRESQRKIQATDQNLIRLHDIVGELKRQLDSLDRQAQKARKYRELKAQIEELDIWLTSKQFAEHQWAIEETRQQLEQLQSQKEIQLTENTRLESELEVLKTQSLELEKELEVYQTQQMEVQLQAQQKELEVQEFKFEVEQARRDEMMTESLLQEQGAREQLLLQDLQQIQSQWELLKSEVQSLQSEYEEKNASFEESQTQRDIVDDQLTEDRRKLFAIGQNLSSLEGRLHGFEIQKESFQERFHQDLLLHEELSKKKDEFFSRFENQQKIHDQHQELLQNHFQELKNLEAEKSLLETEQNQKKMDLDFFKEKFNEVSSRLIGLEDLHRNFEGYQEGVKNLMIWQKAKQRTLQPLSEFLEVPVEYESAMESVLGERLQMLVADESQEALEGLSYLKENQSGRSSFYLTDSESRIQRENTPDTMTSIHDSLRKEEGFSGLLSEVVQIQGQYKPVLAYIFDRVVLVDQMTTALRLRSLYPGWTFATLDGETLSSEGVLTGGGIKNDSESGVLRRRRQIKELREKKDEWEGKLSLVQQILEKFNQQLKEISQKYHDAYSQKQSMDVRAAEIRKDLERAHTEYENATYALDRHHREVQKIKEQMQANDLKYDELLRTIEDLREQKDELDSKVHDLQEELENIELGYSQMQDSVMNLQLLCATKTEQYQGVQKQKEMLEKSLQEIQSQQLRMKEQRSRSSSLCNENQLKQEQKKLDLEKDLLLLSELKLKVSQFQNTFEEMHSVWKERYEQHSNIQKIKNELWVQFNETQLKFEQLQMKAQYSIDQIKEKYMQDLNLIYKEHLQKGGESLTAEQELKDLRERIGRMGEINLSAIEDYDETAKRYEFLSQQQKDLLDAKDQLRRVIDRINRIVSHRFKETFERVNDRFQKVFPVLFGGGEAQLELVEDIEKGEMGIDIIARPPGKKMQNISLLSGGEKALTAVALVFSIFLVKPSPYCLLDEVDAPLDDANVHRFNELVREMSKRSQIIVVTHNKYTMEVTGRLYGVTMQEKGVSTMVSVNLQEERLN